MSCPQKLMVGKFLRLPFWDHCLLIIGFFPPVAFFLRSRGCQGIHSSLHGELLSESEPGGPRNPSNLHMLTSFEIELLFRDVQSLFLNIVVMISHVHGLILKDLI